MNTSYKHTVLYIASEFAIGMIPFAATIINTMAKDPRFKVYSIVMNSGNRTYKDLVIDDAHPIFIEYPSNKIMKLLYKVYPKSLIYEINKILDRKEIDSIHFLTGEFSLAFWNLLTPHKSDLYYTVHDLHPHEIEKESFFRNILNNYIIWGNKVIRKKIPNLTTSSYSQFEELKKMYPYKKISFTHFPTLITFQITNGKKQIPELLNEQAYILFFGSINNYKGIDLLIDSYERSNKLQNIKLVIAGKGIMHEDKTNKNIIRINRFIEDAEIKDLFSKAIIVVYPYRSATMSGVLSLALYFNKQVLASSIPFFMEYKNNNIEYFKVNDVDDLSAKLEALCTKPMNTISSSYTDLYSIEVLQDDYFLLYQK